MKLFIWFAKLCCSGFLFFVIVCIHLTQNSTSKEKKLILNTEFKNIYTNVPEKMQSQKSTLAIFNHKTDSIAFFHMQVSTLYIFKYYSNKSYI